MLQGNRLAVLSPVRRRDIYRVDHEGEFPLDLGTDPNLIRDTIAMYQAASRLYQEGGFKAYALEN